MRKQRTIQERLEQQVFCFGGDAEKDNTTDDAYANQQVRTPGSNTRIDSRGNRVNFNVGPATLDNTPNYTKTLPNGVEVSDFSRPFEGQLNLSSRGMFQPQSTSTVKNPEVMAPVTGTTPLNPDNFVGQAPLGMDTRYGAFNQQLNELQQNNTPTTPAQALQDALSAGRVELGGGFYAGKTPSGLGLGFETTFAQGGPVTAGIGSLLRSAKS
jgi:hypothetical protein